MSTISKLHFITNQWSQTPIIKQVEGYIAGGGKWVQLRLKGYSIHNACEVGKPIAALCRQNNVTLIVNDSVELARELNACGVHLGREDMRPEEARRILGINKIIGATANNLEELEQAITQPINYVGYGPYRFTKTKEKLSAPMGIEGFVHAANFLKNRSCNTPIIAIGGVLCSDVISILSTGVHGVALSGYISNSDNVKVSTELITETIQNN